jgi:hypothetical protein
MRVDGRAGKGQRPFGLISVVGLNHCISTLGTITSQPHDPRRCAYSATCLLMTLTFTTVACIREVDDGGLYLESIAGRGRSWPAAAAWVAGCYICAVS